MLYFFPWDVVDEIFDLMWSVSVCMCVCGGGGVLPTLVKFVINSRDTLH